MRFTNLSTHFGSGGRFEGPPGAHAPEKKLTLPMVVDDVEVCLSSVTMKKTVWGTPEQVRAPKAVILLRDEEKATEGMLDREHSTTG